MEGLKKRDNYALLAIFLAFVGLLIIFTCADRLFGGEYTLCMGDFQGQYVPYVRLFYNNLFSKGVWTYSFSNGLGDNVMANYAYFSCFSPFSLVFLLIKDMYMASVVVILFKYSFAAYAYYKFASNVLKKKGAYVAIFSAAFVLSSFSIFSYINIHMMDALYILPLLMIAIYNYITKDKKCFLVVMYAYSFIVCFYTGYVMGVFTAFCTIAGTLIYFWKANSNKWLLEAIRKLLMYAFLVFDAILISAFVILPSADYVLSNMADDATTFEGMKATFIDVISSLFWGVVQSDATNYPYYYCGVFALVAIPVFFGLDKSILQSKVKIFVGCVLVFIGFVSLNPLGYLFMHCMDAPNGIGYRFGFIVIFTLISIAVYSFGYVGAGNKKAVVGFLVIAGLIYCIYKFANGINNYQVLLGIVINILLLSLYLLPLFNEKRNGQFKRVLSGIIYLEILINGVMICNSIPRPIFSMSAINRGYFAEQESAIEQLPDDSYMYRICEKNAASNISQMYRVNGLGDMFSTFEDYNVRNTLHQLGYFSSARILMDYGSTPVMQSLLGQKYIINMNGIIVDNDIEQAQLITNENALAIGYLVSTDLEKYYLDCEEIDINPFYNQNKLLSSMLGRDVNVFIPINSSISLVSNGLTIGQEDGYIEYSLADATEGQMKVLIEANGYSNVYGYFAQPISVVASDMVPYIQAYNSDMGTLKFYSHITIPHIMELKTNSDGQYEIDITVNQYMSMRTARLYDMLLYTLNTEEYNKIFNELKAGQLDVTEFEDGRIIGEVDVLSDNQLLFFSIPYDKNWRAKVDGEEVSVLPVVNDSFMAIYLEEGHHNIELKYEDSLSYVGICVSLLGGIICLLMYLAQVRAKKVNSDK